VKPGNTRDQIMLSSLREELANWRGTAAIMDI
jgi:hypothetical protein